MSILKARRLVAVHAVLSLWLAPALLGVGNSASADGIWNPSANYFFFADSPFHSVNFTNGYFYLENFEDGLLNTPGVTRTGGIILLRHDDFSDSVDGDDGIIDNNGNTDGATTGSLYSAGLSSLEFDFNSVQLGGQLPTHIGLVMTDAVTNTNMTLRAFRNNMLLGSVTGFQVSEVQHVTQQDRFYGVIDFNGIDRIVIQAESDNDWAMDHLQYGAVPEAISLGDFNLDGVVDAADYVVWRKTDGTQSGYDTWRMHFGETLGNGSGATANVTVPEPATLVMLIMAAAASIPLRLRSIT